MRRCLRPRPAAGRRARLRGAEAAWAEGAKGARRKASYLGGRGLFGEHAIPKNSAPPVRSLRWAEL